MPGTCVVIKIEWIKCEVSTLKVWKIPPLAHYVFWLIYFSDTVIKENASLSVKKKFSCLTIQNVVSDSVLWVY